MCCHRLQRITPPMATPSVSFRITRSTEDLAQTTHALSQRLVKLEQRLEALERQLSVALERREQHDPDELSSLETVEQLLSDCRLLLGLDDQQQGLGDGALDGASAPVLAGLERQAEPGDDWGDDSAEDPAQAA
jgi:type II secretory pathway component PulJ